MIELAAWVIEQADSTERWRTLRELEVAARIGGTMWGRKGNDGVLASTTATVATTEQLVRYTPFGSPDHRSVYRPSRVRIETLAGDLVAERQNPRRVFSEQPAQAPWDQLQAAYFSGYAIWNYLNTPFVFAWPGVQVDELAPWEESSVHTGGNPEKWRCLAVTFPDDIATHNRDQVFYYDAEGRQRRHDYAADVFGGTPTAHYSTGHRSFDGVVFPTLRRVVPRLPDNTTLPEPVLVAIDIDNITLR